MARIGIIGMGFVGTAVHAGFEKENNELWTADPKHGTTVEDVLNGKPEIIFVCVPTPMGDDGVADTSIVESVFEKLRDYRGIPVLKSTVVPSVIERLQTLHPRFVYNPEFLTEARAVYDFLNPGFHVFGGEMSDCRTVNAYYEVNSNCLIPAERDIHFVTPKEAALIKYGVNSFLAAKVMFMNQWKDLCDSVGADYDKVAAGMGSDHRITKSHMMVPGHDGRRGYGSACFSKDLPAIIRESMQLNAELSILRESWNKNCDIRNSYGAPLAREVEQHISFNKI